MSNSTPITKRLVLLFLAICLPFTLVVVLQYGGFKDVESSLQENVTLDERILLLSRLKSNLGYGGAIHVFKNYLLRHEDQYLTKGEQAFSESKVVLEDYRDVKEVTQEELARIRIIEQTMTKYQDAFLTVQSLYG
jgi:methyl-accepting chemotaxis protein